MHVHYAHAKHCNTTYDKRHTQAPFRLVSRKACGQDASHAGDHGHTRHGDLPLSVYGPVGGDGREETTKKNSIYKPVTRQQLCFMVFACLMGVFVCVCEAKSKECD